jgi:predicted O-methyltransferase YrrM
MLAARSVSTLLHYALWRLRLTQATTQTTRAERDAMARHASGRRRLVEVGVWHGVTTKRLRAAMPVDAELWAVDPYARGRLRVSFPELIARAEVSSVENGTVHWVRATGAAAAAQFRREAGGSADFVFIDGDHSWDGIRADWEAWSDLVGQNGVICLHDSRSTPERPIDDAGSVRYTQAVILQDPRYRRIDEVGSLTVVERVA